MRLGAPSVFNRTASPTLNVMAVPPVAARDARFAPCRLGPSPPSEIICHRSRGCIKAGAKILQKIAQNPAANLIRASRFFTQPLTNARRRLLGVGYGNAHAASLRQLKNHTSGI